VLAAFNAIPRRGPSGRRKDAADGGGGEAGGLGHLALALALADQAHHERGLVGAVALLAAELDAGGLSALAAFFGAAEDQVALELSSSAEDADDQLGHLAEAQGVDTAVKGADVAATVEQLSDAADAVLHGAAEAIQGTDHQDVALGQGSQCGLEFGAVSQGSGAADLLAEDLGAAGPLE